jgi:hypothetical protein
MIACTLAAAGMLAAGTVAEAKPKPPKPPKLCDRCDTAG